MKSENVSESQLRNCDYEIKEQDRYLPIANVARVMKLALPQQAKLSKESKECVQECVSEFISFITSQAIDRCTLEKRKTLNGEDILWAMFTLGFEHYAETLKIYLAKYREFEQMEAERRQSSRKRRPRAGQLYDSESDSEVMSTENFEFEDSPEEPYVNFEGFNFANSA
ncbi:CIC11C00000002367 [Sungouiella intermedia]|uniref:CIC11C00000002367 n=1 Tax=Sungouiella intermedia TaxID=45354 RepID=A0A1L0DCX8_9ASCO|nr:CIC11C00000002367 [[Candida] intermedia]